MFRFQDNVPEVYVDSSRDFQLFCRLLDIIQSSLKYSIDSLQHVTTTNWCNSAVLPLLSSKLGFNSTINITDESLRSILDAFPTLIKYKGSKRGIEYAINIVRRIVHDKSNDVYVDWSKIDDHHLTIEFDTTTFDTTLFEQLLNYIIPCGFTYSVGSSTRSSYLDTLQVKNELSVNEIMSTKEIGDDDYLINESVIYIQEETNEQTGTT